MRIYLLVVAFLFTVLPAQARSRWVEAPQWSSHFQRAGVNGSFLLYDLKQSRYTFHNRKRAQTRFLPASTFKILNSLSALDAGAVRDENEVLRWDGITRSISTWNADHDMKSAFANSTLWFYQEMARRVGDERMRQMVRAVRYGNADISGGLDHFWLDGELRISSEEQIQFLVRLHQNRLPFSSRALGIVKNIMVQERGKDWILRGKTGWAGLGSPDAQQTGWLIGYVERRDNAYFYSINIDIRRDENAAARAVITKAILREMKILD